MTKLNIPSQNNDVCVFVEQIAEKIFNPAKFEDRIFSISIFVADKIVNIEAMAEFNLNQS